MLQLSKSDRKIGRNQSANFQFTSSQVRSSLDLGGWLHNTLALDWHTNYSSLCELSWLWVLVCVYRQKPVRLR